jgi:hypothetical protein
MVAADGRGNGYTLAAGARSARRDTRRVRQNAAAASPVGMMTLRGKLRRHQPRVLLCRRASDPLRTGGTYAVQVTSERSAAEADASFRALRAKLPNQLGGREPIVRRTDFPLRQWKRRLECAAHCRLQAATASFKEIESTLDHRSGDCRCSSSKLLIPPR